MLHLVVGAPSAVCDSPAPRGWQPVEPHVDQLWEKTPPERSSASLGRTRTTARRVGGAEPRVSNALWDFDVSWYLGVEGAVRTRCSSSTSDHVQSPIYARVQVVCMSAQGGGRSGGKLGREGNDQVRQGEPQAIPPPIPPNPAFLAVRGHSRLPTRIRAFPGCHLRWRWWTHSIARECRGWSACHPPHDPRGHSGRLVGGRLEVHEAVVGGRAGLWCAHAGGVRCARDHQVRIGEVRCARGWVRWRVAEVREVAAAVVVRGRCEGGGRWERACEGGEGWDRCEGGGGGRWRAGG